MAVFMDQGETRRLRSVLGDAVKGDIYPKVLKYNKPLIHVTLLRPMDVFPAKTLASLRRKQRELFYLLCRDISMPVKHVLLGRETGWMHTEVQVLEQFPLA